MEVLYSLSSHGAYVKGWEHGKNRGGQRKLPGGGDLISKPRPDYWQGGPVDIIWSLGLGRF